MRRRLLLIYKDPEFDERGEVILGQCEPFTSGWKLVLIQPDAARETLLTGTYTDLRKIQESCAALEQPEAVKERARQMTALLTSAVTETVAVEFTPSKPHDSTQLRPAAAAVPAGRAEVPEQLGDGLLELHEEGGALVALVADPARASDATLLVPQLNKLLALKPRAILIDLTRVQHLASRAANELVLFRDHCEEERIAFGLCHLRKGVWRLFENLGHAHPPAVYASTAAALAEMGREGS